MVRLFGSAGLRIDPEVLSTVQTDYWEEFNRVNDAFVHEPDLVITKAKKVPKPVPDVGVGESTRKHQGNGVTIPIHNSLESKTAKVYPDIHPVPKSITITSDDTEYVEFRSIGVQTEGNFDEEPELPYKCCFCFRSTTPCVVWAFVIISIVFFKMGAIVTGRWIYLSSASFDEVVFYIAFTVCLGFATLYFRRGTKYHNPFDLLFLILTVPMMWALLTFTTVFLKKDMFFYVGSVIYSVFVIPYTIMGAYMAFRFWKQGKLFLRRVEGSKYLEPFCRKLFLMQSLIIFDAQLSICASIISMAPTVNHSSSVAWVSSLVIGPMCMICAIVGIIVGYFAIRKENRKLTWAYTILNMNQFLLVLSMLIKRPTAPGAYFAFISGSVIFWSSALLAVHIGALIILWRWVVPIYGMGLKGPVRRTSGNNCIQFAKLTCCR